jgi:hypothetical protein
MRYFIAVFFLIITFNSNARIPNISAEDTFWKLVADFELNLKDKTHAQSSIEKLALLLNEFDDVDAKNELIFRTVQFLKVHSTIEELDDYMMKNLRDIPHNHYSYLKLQTDYVVLLDFIGKDKEKTKMLEVLNSKNSSENQSFLLALNLYLDQEFDSYEKLNYHCSNICNFSLYHIAIMEFLKANKKYVELDIYAKNLLNLMIGKKLIINNIFFSEYVIAYLSFALKNLSQADLAKSLIDRSIESVSDQSFVYYRLKHAVK